MSTKESKWFLFVVVSMHSNKTDIENIEYEIK